MNGCFVLSSVVLSVLVEAISSHLWYTVLFSLLREIQNVYFSVQTNHQILDIRPIFDL